MTPSGYWCDGHRRATLTCLLQGHHGGLFDQVALDETPEVLAVHAEVRQLERVDGHLQGQLLALAVANHVGPRQRHDGRTGVRDAPGQSLL